MNQEEWYKEQGISYEFMHTCTACGKWEVEAHLCHDGTKNEHVCLCHQCYGEFLGLKPAGKKMVKLLKRWAKRRRENGRTKSL